MSIKKMIAIAVMSIILLGTIAPIAIAAVIPVSYVAVAEPVETLQETITVNEERQRFAHEFAELARYFGYPEDSALIKNAQVEWRTAKHIIDESKTKIEESAYIDLHYSPTKRVGLSVEAFDRMLLGSNLEGQGKTFYDLEQTYDINGIFAIGVANTESTLGRNCYGFNPYGMLTSSRKLIRFDSWYDSTMFFGELMQKDWYFDKSVENIARTYCPPTYTSWADSVNWTMEQMYSKISD